MSDSASLEPTKPGWRARWYLWDGGFLTLGRGGPTGGVPPHAHHAIQVTVGLDGPIGHREPDSSWGTYGGAIVAADVAHELDPRGSLLAILFVDPETREGRWLTRSIRQPISSIPERKVEEVSAVLREIWEEPADAPETAALIHSITRRLCVGPAPPYVLDERIVQALGMIRRMDTSRISLESVAKSVFLSPSRFAHLFTAQVGLPFRRYVLWRRFTRAMIAVGRGSTLSAAAHATGFSDSAHLTRTSYQMLGQPPSTLLGAGEFYEIPAPFELPFPSP